MSEDERRIASRHDAVVVVEVATGEKAGRFGVTRNASARGFLFATRTRFTAGDRVELTLHGKVETVSMHARVIRVDETPQDESWRYRVAVEVDEDLPEALLEEGMSFAARALDRISNRPPPGAAS